MQMCFGVDASVAAAVVDDPICVQACGALSWSDKAAAVSQVLEIFAVRSAKKAVEQKASEAAAASRHSYFQKQVDTSSSAAAAATLDATHSRKHVTRTLHFTFLLLEALKRCLSTAVDGDGSTGKKRKAGAEPAAGADPVGYCMVRNAFQTDFWNSVPPVVTFSRSIAVSSPSK